jgi:hypothetical protein
MDDERLRTLRADVEGHVAVPDFEVIGARAQRIRRRRGAVAAVVAVVAAAVVAVGVHGVVDANRTLPPVQRPPVAPSIDPEGARRVLTAADAQVDTDLSAVDGTGDMLAVVVVPGSSFTAPRSGCASDTTPSAIRWSAPGGRSHAWIDQARAVRPLGRGFVVAALPAGCRPRAAGQADAYLVDRAGVPQPLTWSSQRARAVCAVNPTKPRCRFDVGAGTGSLANVRVPTGAQLIGRDDGGPWWARSTDARRMYWSTDGTYWHHRDSALPPGAIVTASAAGSWAVLAGDTAVEVTSDGGRTWRARDLASALRGLSVADVEWTVTGSGELLGVTQLVGRGDVLFRSTDSSWTRFTETGVHTAFGAIHAIVQGSTVYVVDDERYAVSTDGGARWHRTPALP